MNVAQDCTRQEDPLLLLFLFDDEATIHLFDVQKNQSIETNVLISHKIREMHLYNQLYVLIVCLDSVAVRRPQNMAKSDKSTYVQIQKCEGSCYSNGKKH